MLLVAARNSQRSYSLRKNHDYHQTIILTTILCPKECNTRIRLFYRLTEKKGTCTTMSNDGERGGQQVEEGKEDEEDEEFEDYHVSEQEIQDMKVEAKEILEGNPQLRLLSDEEAEEQGEQNASDTSTFLKTLASQRIQRGEISEQEANRGFRQDYIRMRN